MYDVVASELLSAGACNMNCQYCFIPKNEELKNIHSHVIESMKDGTYIELLKTMHGDKLEALSLWGTEPTLTLKYFIPHVKDLLDNFKKMKELKLSTNLLINHMDIVELAKEIDKHLKLLKNPDKFNMGIQLSLDGPENITDKNRHDNATNTILKHYMELLNGLNIKYENLKNIEVHFKPTITIDNMINDLGTIDKVIAWYRFFDNLCGKQNKIIVPGAMPTFVVPGEYTSEDGKIAYELFKRISEVNKLNREQKLFKNYGQLNNYVLRFMRLIRFNRELSYKYRMFTCSGGNSNYGMDNNGNVHFCHETFFFDNEAYLSQTYKNDSDRGRKKMAIKNEIFHIDDEYNKTRIQYLNRCCHDYMSFKINTVITMVKELALCGQASREYLYNDDLCYLLVLFLNTCMSCPVKNYLCTGSVNIVPISLVRLLANGCMEEIVREVRNEL